MADPLEAPATKPSETVEQVSGIDDTARSAPAARGGMLLRRDGDRRAGGRVRVPPERGDGGTFGDGALPTGQGGLRAAPPAVRRVVRPAESVPVAGAAAHRPRDGRPPRRAGSAATPPHGRAGRGSSPTARRGRARLRHVGPPAGHADGGAWSAMRGRHRPRRPQPGPRARGRRPVLPTRGVPPRPDHGAGGRGRLWTVAPQVSTGGLLGGLDPVHQPLHGPLTQSSRRERWPRRNGLAGRAEGGPPPRGPWPQRCTVRSRPVTGSMISAARRT